MDNGFSRRDRFSQPDSLRGQSNSFTYRAPSRDPPRPSPQPYRRAVRDTHSAALANIEPDAKTGSQMDDL